MAPEKSKSMNWGDVPIVDGFTASEVASIEPVAMLEVPNVPEWAYTTMKALVDVVPCRYPYIRTRFKILPSPVNDCPESSKFVTSPL